MVVYNVTVNIDHDVQEEWLKWMLEVHIPEVLATGLFMDGRISRLQMEEDMGGVTYSIQYTLPSQAHLDQYQREFAPALQKKHTDRYAEKFVAFRTVMDVMGHLYPPAS